MTKQQVAVGSLGVGDVVVLVEGDVPFVVVAVSGVVGQVRQLDVRAVRGGRSCVRITASVHREVSVIGRERSDGDPREVAVAAAS